MGRDFRGETGGGRHRFLAGGSSAGSSCPARVGRLGPFFDRTDARRHCDERAYVHPAARRRLPHVAAARPATETVSRKEHKQIKGGGGRERKKMIGTSSHVPPQLLHLLRVPFFIPQLCLTRRSERRSLRRRCRVHYLAFTQPPPSRVRTASLRACECLHILDTPSSSAGAVGRASLLRFPSYTALVRSVGWSSPRPSCPAAPGKAGESALSRELGERQLRRFY